MQQGMRIVCTRYRVLALRLDGSQHGNISAPLNVECVCLTLIMNGIAKYKVSFRALAVFSSLAANKIYSILIISA
jgi:hypothetical protein